MRARQSYKPHFLRTFENQSPFYNSLSPTEKDQFWHDLVHWPNPLEVDWAHFFVNMVLGCIEKGQVLIFENLKTIVRKEPDFHSWIPKGSKGVESSPKKEVFLVNR